MANKITFPAQERLIIGKKVSQLRRKGLVPANIFGRNLESVPIIIHAQGFRKLYDQVGDTGLLYLQIENQNGERPVLVDEVVFHPLTDQIQHVAFRQVDLKEKITAAVPVELIGEFKVSGAVVIAVYNEIEVEALPTDLPDKFTIDISQLSEIGQGITFEQLSYDKSKVTLLVEEAELQSPIALVQEVKEEVEPEPEATAPAEGETPTEGTSPAEGEAATSPPAAEGDKS